MTGHRQRDTTKPTTPELARAKPTGGATAAAYLHVMPHGGQVDAPRRWHVFQVSDASPRITPAATVTSWDEAHTLAIRADRPLHIARQAWHQMRAAEVAPEQLPDDATLV